MRTSAGACCPGVKICHAVCLQFGIFMEMFIVLWSQFAAFWRFKLKFHWCTIKKTIPNIFFMFQPQCALKVTSVFLLFENINVQVCGLQYDVTSERLSIPLFRYPLTYLYISHRSTPNAPVQHHMRTDIMYPPFKWRNIFFSILLDNCIDL